MKITFSDKWWEKRNKVKKSHHDSNKTRDCFDICWNKQIKRTPKKKPKFFVWWFSPFQCLRAKSQPLRAFGEEFWNVSVALFGSDVIAFNSGSSNSKRTTTLKRADFFPSTLPIGRLNWLNASFESKDMEKKTERLKETERNHFDKKAARTFCVFGYSYYQNCTQNNNEMEWIECLVWGRPVAMQFGIRLQTLHAFWCIFRWFGLVYRCELRTRESLTHWFNTKKS